MSECLLHVPGEARSKDVLLRPELMTRLPNDGVDDIKSRNLIFRLALEDELFHVLHDMLIKLNCLHCRLGDCTHLSLRYGDLVVVERK